MNKNSNSRTMESRGLPRRLPLSGGLFLAALALTSILTTANRASAHAEFERSEPAEDSVIAESPERIDMWFSQEMARSGGLPRVEVVNQAGDLLAEEPVLDDEDRTHTYIELPPELPDGRYTVMWYNLSDEDGEESQGAFHFYVGQQPQDHVSQTSAPSGGETIAPTTVVSDTGGGDDDGDGAPWWVVAVVAIGGLSLGAAGTFAVAGGRSGNRDEPGANP